MDISPLRTEHQGPIPCHEEHQLPEPSIDERTNDEKKHLAKLTFPSRDIRYHLLKTDSVKNHQKTRPRKTNSSISSCENNTKKISDKHTPLKEAIHSTAVVISVKKKLLSEGKRRKKTPEDLTKTSLYLKTMKCVHLMTRGHV